MGGLLFSQARPSRHAVLRFKEFLFHHTPETVLDLSCLFSSRKISSPHYSYSYLLLLSLRNIHARIV